MACFSWLVTFMQRKTPHTCIAFIFAGCQCLKKLSSQIEQNDTKNIPITDSEKSGTETRSRPFLVALNQKLGS